MSVESRFDVSQGEVKVARSRKLRGNKDLKLPLRQVVDNIIFTEREIWAVYKLPTHSFSFLGARAKVDLASRLCTPFVSLMSDRNKPVPFKIVSYNFPVDLDKWEEQLNEASESWSRAVGYQDYVALQRNLLEQAEFTERTVFLCVGLAKRGELDFDSLNVFEVGLKAAKESLSKFVKTAFFIPTDDVSADEERFARQRESKVFEVLGQRSALKASRASAAEILLATKRMFYPAMPAPYLTGSYESRLGAGDLLVETEGLVENGFRFLKFTQDFNGFDVEGYRTCLTFAQFPRTMSFPSGAPPFLYVPSQQEVPFTTWISGFLYPSEKMKKELRKKQLEAKDELENMAGAQTAVEAAVSPNVDVSDNVRDIREMAELLASDKSPWVSASYHVVVEAQSLEDLKRYVEGLRQDYQDQDIKIIQTPGDQKELFVEQCFGAPKVIKDFDQLTNLPILPTSGFSFATAVGDEIKGSLSSVRGLAADPVW